MENENYNLYAGDLYDYNNGVYCGVLVTKKVMVKLAKLQAEHLRKVKAVLLDELDEGNVFPSMWTLHYPNEKQTTVNFIYTKADAKQSIRNAVHSNQPRKIEKVFIAESMDDAKKQADSLFESLEKGEPR